eukprot:CAMPEP_0170454836 /NCGR_PEP_ID=MMETSP0123-20130129/2954_1 /TAXON_ID=182087 /ORGANISM="Favella ehrenbergii, Strain Fehren 1" /LENGTH=36 /DNA_ID= /DNA_START= /DNA_END= /DNA_ORIENTATION=
MTSEFSTQRTQQKERRDLADYTDYAATSQKSNTDAD